jgi:hypothetical protein
MLMNARSHLEVLLVEQPHPEDEGFIDGAGI